MKTLQQTPWAQKATLLALSLALLAAPGRATAAEPPAHSQARCAICHAAGQTLASTRASATTQCGSCHEANSPALASSSFHGKSQERCLECHSFHKPKQVAILAMGGQIPSPGAINTPVCLSCHDSRGDLASLSPAHRKAAQLYHAQAAQVQNISPSQTCLNCHSNQSTSSWQDQTNGAVIAFSEHASHPFGIRVVPGAGDSSNWIARDIDPRLTLIDGRMECQTCHLLTAANDDLMVPFPTKYDLCKGCHRHYGDQDPQLVVARISR